MALANDDLAFQSQIRLDRPDRIGGHPKRPGGDVNTPGLAPDLEVQMPEDRTAPHGEQWFTWTVSGESYRPGSHPYRSEHYKSEITAESAGEALEKIVRGLGEGTTGDNTIPWDMIEQDRPITITIEPTPDA